MNVFSVFVSMETIKLNKSVLLLGRYHLWILLAMMIPDVQDENTAVRLSAAVNIPFKWKGVGRPLHDILQGYSDRMKYFKRVEMGKIFPCSVTVTTSD